MSIFSQNKPPRIKRSKFSLSHERVLSCNFGEIVPIMCQEIIPGDKFSISSEVLIKLAPMASPAFSRIDASVHFFFVPNRLVWSGWERWISSTVDGQAGSQTSITDRYMPSFPTFSLKVPGTSQANFKFYDVGSLFDYMTGNAPGNSSTTADLDMRLKISQLPFRAYQMIYDEYYRDENVGPKPLIDAKDGSQEDYFKNGGRTYVGNVRYRNTSVDATVAVPTTQLTDSEMLGDLLTLRIACWRKDYFTSALPWSQRGPGASLLIDSDILNPPATTLPTDIQHSHYLQGTSASTQSQHVAVPDFDVRLNTAQNAWKGTKPSGGTFANAAVNAYSGNITVGTEGPIKWDPNGTLTATNALGINIPPGPLTGSTSVHDATHQHDIDFGATSVVGGIMVNDVRRAFQLQRWLERTARGGYRYIEQILAHFGVMSSDRRLDRPEYLGGGKVPIVIGDVYQTAPGSSSQTQLANRAGHGNSYGTVQGPSHHHFEEHGYLIANMTVRPRALYQYGFDRTFLKGANGDKFDYYWPEFAHIGEQPIYNCEIGASNNTNAGSQNLDTWGYVPRYHEYRFQKSTVHGDFKTSLKFWHQARDVFAGSTSASDPAPPLNNAFLLCNDASNYQPFYVTNASTDHLWCFINNHIHALRPIPRFSDPGYADH